VKTSELENLEKNLSILGKNAHLNIAQRQRIRDRLFRQIGQLDIMDAVQTDTDTSELVVPLNRLKQIFQPRRTMISLPATLGIVALVFVATLATSVAAKDALPGSFWYPARKAFDSVKVVITPSSQKADVLLSIASERIGDIAEAPNLDAALRESRKAIVSAQTAVAALSEADEETSAELLNKLKAIIDSQKTILATIVKENIDDEAIQQSVIAVREELDELLPETTTPAEKAEDSAEEAVPTEGYVSFSGTMGSYTAKPTIMVGDTRYFLAGSDISLIQFMGIGDATAFGYLEGDTITLSKLLIGGKVVFEASHNSLNQSADGGASAL